MVKSDDFIVKLYIYLFHALLIFIVNKEAAACEC
jgi:hypothetical protein